MSLSCQHNVPHKRKVHITGPLSNGNRWIQSPGPVINVECISISWHHHKENRVDVIASTALILRSVLSVPKSWVDLVHVLLQSIDLIICSRPTGTNCWVGKTNECCKKYGIRKYEVSISLNFELSQISNGVIFNCIFFIRYIINPSSCYGVPFPNLRTFNSWSGYAYTKNTKTNDVLITKWWNNLFFITDLRRDIILLWFATKMCCNYVTYSLCQANCKAEILTLYLLTLMKYMCYYHSSTQGLHSLWRPRLIGIGIPNINLRRSSDCLWVIMGIPIPAGVRWRLFSQWRPRSGTGWSPSTRKSRSRYSKLSILYMPGHQQPHYWPSFPGIFQPQHQKCWQNETEKGTS